MCDEVVWSKDAKDCAVKNMSVCVCVCDKVVGNNLCDKVVCEKVVCVCDKVVCDQAVCVTKLVCDKVACDTAVCDRDLSN